jgi:signal transduction histidine kinase
MVTFRRRQPIRHWWAHRIVGLAAGVALVGAITTIIAGLEQHRPPPILLVVYVFAVLPIALLWGLADAVVVAITSAFAFLYFFLAPEQSLEVSNRGQLLSVAVFAIVAVSVAELAARARRSAGESERARAALADEQAALRRVATLVAREPSPSEVFSAVAEESGRLLRADLTHMHRYEGGGMWTVVAGWSAHGRQIAVGTRWHDDGGAIVDAVVQASRPVRIEHDADATLSISRLLHELGVRSSIGTPIVVDGKVWGMMAVCTRSAASLQAGTEARIADFTDLVGTAVANAQSRIELQRLAEEQAALRRVAMLVAHESAPVDVFAAVAEEAGRLIGADATCIQRSEADRTVTVVAGHGTVFSEMPVGTRHTPGPETATAQVIASGRPARMEGVKPDRGGIVALLYRHGLRSTAGAPILVEGRLWGVLLVGSAAPLAVGTELRMEDFAELVAVAISNAETRAELTASRARIVTAADEERRRIERDLHDGVQQRLISLGLQLRSAQAALRDDQQEVRTRLDDVADGLVDTFDDVREIARGIHPAIRARGGLGPALKALARRSPVPATVEVRALGDVPEPIQVAAYYVACEGFVNAARHGQASVVRFRAERVDGRLRVSVSDDGVGGADPARGSGLIGLSDRVGALGGTLAVASPVGGGTSIVAELPATYGTVS